IILNENEKDLPNINLKDITITKVNNEASLVEEFVNVVINFDPDIISGYEIQNSSWDNLESSFDQEKDEWGYKKSSSIHIPGRIVLNIWRLMKAEYDLISYSVENIVNIIFNESEFARIFGVLFFECISRGSQYKIESMLLRIIKPENYIVLSPSKQQVSL
ncbi:hypothetical protein PIROE2DRAFT_11213, partial [Piromyces sp. E2]